MAYTTPAQLSSRLSPGTYLAIFDVANTGSVPDDSPDVQLVISLAHAQVVSWLVAIYGASLPQELPAATSTLLQAAELDYAVAYSLEMHPEYVRSYGEEKRAARWNRAESIMQRIQAGTQQIPATDNPPPAQPGNIGGIIFASGPRMVIDTPDGCSNGGDF